MNSHRVRLVCVVCWNVESTRRQTEWEREWQRVSWEVHIYTHAHPHTASPHLCIRITYICGHWWVVGNVRALIRTMELFISTISVSRNATKAMNFDPYHKMTSTDSQKKRMIDKIPVHLHRDKMHPLNMNCWTDSQTNEKQNEFIFRPWPSLWHRRNGAHFIHLCINMLIKWSSVTCCCCCIALLPALIQQSFKCKSLLNRSTHTWATNADCFPSRDPMKADGLRCGQTVNQYWWTAIATNANMCNTRHRANHTWSHLRSYRLRREPDRLIYQIIIELSGHALYVHEH